MDNPKEIKKKELALAKLGSYLTSSTEKFADSKIGLPKTRSGVLRNRNQNPNQRGMNLQNPNQGYIQPQNPIGMNLQNRNRNRNRNLNLNQRGMNLQNQKGTQPQNKKPTFDQKNVVYKLIYDNKDAIFNNILKNAKIQQRNTTKNMVQQRNTTKNMVQQRNNFHILETFVNFSTLFGKSTKEIIIEKNLEFADGNKALYNLQTGKYLKIKKNGLNINDLYLVEDDVSVIMDKFNTYGPLNYTEEFYLINPKHF